MSTYDEAIEGREFDWFAIDKEGNLALFSTAGEGFIPASAIESYQEHDEISEKLDSPSWGTAEVWSDYANLGLYVYDWELPGGPYQRQEISAKNMPQELKQRIIETAVAIDISFPQTETFKSV